MLDLRPLRHFIRIVDLGSMSRAAAEVGIAQPALSQHIASLEAEFGVKLLDRGPQGAKPTECGRVLYRHAQLLLRQMDEARQAVRSQASEVRGTVTLGLSPTTAEILSIPLLTKCLATLPHVHLQIISLPNRLLVEMLMNGRLDLATLFDYSSGKNIKAKAIANEEMFFLTGQQSKPVKHRRQVISLSEISKHPLLLPCRPHSARMLLEAVLARAGYPCRVIAEIDAVPSLIEAVESGIGATVLPWSAFHRHVPSAKFSYYSCSDRLMREMSLSVSGVLPLSSAAAATFDLIEQMVAELMSSGKWQGLRPPGDGTDLD